MLSTGLVKAMYFNVAIKCSSVLKREIYFKMDYKSKCPTVQSSFDSQISWMSFDKIVAACSSFLWGFV